MSITNNYPYGNNKFDAIRGELFDTNIKPKKIHYEYYLALERRNTKINYQYPHERQFEKCLLKGAFSTFNKSQLEEMVHTLLLYWLNKEENAIQREVYINQLNWFNYTFETERKDDSPQWKLYAPVGNNKITKNGKILQVGCPLTWKLLANLDEPE